MMASEEFTMLTARKEATKLRSSLTTAMECLEEKIEPILRNKKLASKEATKLRDLLTQVVKHFDNNIAPVLLTNEELTPSPDSYRATDLCVPNVELAPGRCISSNEPCFFIAEIGQNHQGSFETAKELIKAAHFAGADCVKFQKTSISHKFTDAALKRPYLSAHSWGKTYGEHKQYLELSDEDFRALKSYANSLNLAFSASPKDIPSLKFLLEMDVPFIKIGSGDSEDFVMLREAAASHRPLVISTGMLDMKMVDHVYRLVKSYHNNFVLLQCVSSYPTQSHDVNLNVIKTYQERFPDIPVGYSGHEEGIAISIAAAALGAKVIERHLTLDKSQKGNDHQCSLLPEEFRSMVRDVRTIERALGAREKRFLSCEEPCYEKLGKSLVAAENLEPGTVLSADHIALKVHHPKGIPAKKYRKIMGRKLTRTVHRDHAITTDSIDENV